MNKKILSHCVLGLLALVFVAQDANALLSAITDLDSSTDEVLENSPAGKAVKIRAHATGNSAVTYSLDDDADGRFAVDASSGEVFTTGVELDSETSATQVITVRASSFDINSPRMRTFTITIVDENDVAPVITPGQVFNVVESVSDDTSLGLVQATDGDISPAFGELKSWRIDAGNDAGIFKIVGGTGELRVKKDLNPGEVTVTYTLTLGTSDGSNDALPQTVKINVGDVNDVAPVITPGQVFNVVENASDGTVVGTVQATDGDLPAAFRQIQNWRIDAGNDAGIFEIVAATGQLRVKDDQSLDAEVAVVHTLTLGASDGLNAALPITVKINVDDINDVAPVINSLLRVEVDENELNVMVVTAIDPDTVGSKVFSITGGWDENKFVINSATGALSFVSAPDFEQPQDSNTDNVYYVRVRVSDGVGSDEEYVGVRVLNVSDTAPVSKDGSITVAEDSIYTFSPVKFYFADVDGDTFAGIKITTLPARGKFRFAGADVVPGQVLAVGQISGLTYQPGTNESATAYANFRFRIEDSSGQQSVADYGLNVDVTAVADLPSVAVSNTIIVEEDTSFNIGLSTSLVDVDSETLSVRLRGLPAGAQVTDGVRSATSWSVNISGWNYGAVTVTPAANSDVDFTLQVTATATEADNGSQAQATKSIAVQVVGIADKPLLTTTPASGDEDTAISLQITAQLADVDGSESLKIFISGVPVGARLADGAQLAISSGAAIDISSWLLSAITVRPASNVNDDFTVTITATAIEQDNGDQASQTGSIVVTVNAVNDSPTVLDQAFSIAENAVVGTFVGQIVATDIEPVGGEPAQTLAYQLSGTAFSIDGSGKIWVNDSALLDFETQSQLLLALDVTDSGLPPLSATAAVTINLIAVNDNPPVGVADLVNVDEQNTVVFNVLDNDTDADLPASTLVVKSLNGDTGAVGVAQDITVGGVVVGALTVNADGSAQFVATPDPAVELFSAAANYVVSDGLFDSAPAFITIEITPRNDNQPAISAAGLAVQGAGLQYAEDEHTSLANVLSLPIYNLFYDLDIDADGEMDSNTAGDRDALVFALQSNNNATLLDARVVDGVLQVFSRANEHGEGVLEITATDTAAPAERVSSVSLAIAVAVTSVNDAPVYQAGSLPDITRDEDAGLLLIDLAGAFVDADMTDSNSIDDSLTYMVTIDDIPAEFVMTDLLDVSGLGVISDLEDTPVAGTRQIVVQTNDASLGLVFNPDAFGTLNVTVRATDQGRPPALPSAAVPLSAEASFQVVINGVIDDQPIAVDDHYSNNPLLVVLEDSGPIDIYVIGNDYQGDVPAGVINAGQTIIDSFNVGHSWRTTSRLADDPFNPGNLIITINGEVACAAAGCSPSGDSVVSQVGIDVFSVRYMPMPDFNGEDVFTYCIEDASSVGESAFTPPNDSRCATVTINVLPQNDLPTASGPIYFFMDQAGILQRDAANGLLPWVHDVDNSHRDGLGCDPSGPPCLALPQSDQLYFRFTSAITAHGELLPPYNADGSFTYQPDADFDGEDSFTFDVCDVPLPGDASHCIYGIEALIVVNPIDGAPQGAVNGVVEYDYQLADAPLELPIGPEPNVLIIEDDSRSMEWDLSTSSLEGVFYFPQRLSTQLNRDSSDSLYWVMAASATDSWSIENSKIAPTEEQFPGQGFWTLRSASENKIYYDPAVQYRPWDGLDTSDQPFPDSPPTAAKHYPWLAASAANTTDLTLDPGVGYTGRALEGKNVCVAKGVCIVYDKKDKCKKWAEVCSTEYELNEVSVNGFYIPRYYAWEDKNNNGKLDYTPSPKDGNPLSEGRLVEIRPANAPFPKSADRTDCITTETSCSYTEELQNFANWFTYARTRELTAKMALGRVVAKSESLRMGYALLNDDNYNKKIISMNTSERTGPKAALLDAIYLSPTLGGTPLRRKLRDAGRYFACENQNIFGSNQKSAFGAVDAQGYADCPVLPAPAGNCQQNFVLMITDGTWSGQPPNVHETDDDNDTNFDGDVYAGAPSDTLADIAMYYYEYDLHPALADQVATNSRDKAGASATAFAGGGNEYMHQHMTTYTIGFGAKGLITAPPVFVAGTAGTFDWGDPMSDARSPAKIDDLRHAAFNGRGEHLDASSVNELTQALISAFEEFSQGSGTASAVSFNSQEVQAGTLIFRAFYNTKTNAGNLVAQAISASGLDPVPVWEAAKTLDAIAATDRQIITLDRINNTGIKFRAEALNAEQRQLFIADPGASEAVKLGQITDRVNYLRGDASLERPFGDFRERPVKGGRLGDLVHSAPVFVGSPDRLRRTLSPYPQDDPYAAFKSAFGGRKKVVYVSANDGMLHGFDANNGQELIAYVPDNLMLGKYSRKITELLDYQYSHRFFVDLTPALNDVYMDADRDGDREWTTLMIGGQGAGGKAYFGLNVTDPTKFSEATAADVALWEFTDADDSYPTTPVTVDEITTMEPLTTATGEQRRDLQAVPQPVKDLGYSFSVPTIVMSNLKNDGENEWVAIFGNGYNSTAGIAKLFVLLVDHGADGTWCHPDMIHNTILNGDLPEACIGKQDFVKIDTGFGAEGGYPNGLGTPRAIDTDGNGTVDYAYAGDTFGNFYRFDLRSDNFAEWTSTKIFKAEYTGGIAQAITSQPIVTAHPTQDDGFLVIFGTGSYVTVPDGADTSIQSIYGLWDRLGPELITTSQMVQQSYTNLVDPVFGPLRSLSSNPVDYVANGGKRGWYIHLDVVPADGVQGTDLPEFPGERAVRNIQLRGDVAFVNSVIPRGTDSCIKVDGGFGLAFCPSTGGANCFASSSVFDLNQDGKFDGNDQTNGVAVAGIRFEDSVPSDSAFIGSQRVTQLSDQSLNVTLTNTQQGIFTGRLSWKQLDSVD